MQEEVRFRAERILLKDILHRSQNSEQTAITFMLSEVTILSSYE